MGVFDDISLEWAGKKFTIPSNRVLGAIHRVEDVLTLRELTQARGAPVGRLASAFGNLLRYAGAKVEDEEVYVSMFPGGSDDIGNIQTAVGTLLAVMVPPNVMKSTDPEAAKEPEGKFQPAAVASSKKPSRRRSASGE